MFLPMVMPPLLKALEAEVKFSIETADPDDDGEVRGQGEGGVLMSSSPQSFDH